MRIAYFANQFAQYQGHGVARFTRNLFWAMKAADPQIQLQPVAAWSDRPADNLAAWRKETGLHLLPWGRKLTPLLWTHLNFPPLEWGLPGKVDLVHSQSLGYAVSTRKPYLITIHDIGPLSHPHFFTDKPNWILRKSLERALKQAQLFICVSQTTADALQEYARDHYQTDLTGRIRVILEGVEERFFAPPPLEALSELPALPEAPFFLAVGAISPRKNLQTLLDALGLLQKKLDHHLVVVGGEGWGNQDLLRKVNALKLKGRVHLLGYVSDQALHALYAKAEAFVYPSLFEGFGLTVLEAMAVGCPVITTNFSSLPEVAGKAALLVDSRSAEALAEAMEAVIQDQTLAQNLRQSGPKRAAEFRWNRCAQETLAVYREMQPQYGR